ncbi:MAG TPA: choice-of-anchor tandem repeat GloVer-containing protein [Rhizomicrobium sp.]
MQERLNTGLRRLLCAAALAALAVPSAHASMLNTKHAFDGVNDGGNSLNGLIKVGNFFYGVTTTGGAHNLGTVFKMTASGAITVLHSFAGGADGATPRGELVNVDGVDGSLYGTTLLGGSGGFCPAPMTTCGTVYKIDLPTSVESVVYTFQGNLDGANPAAGLIYSGGVLYGTTLEGGNTYFGSCDTTYNSCGTVFSLTLGGTETVIHRFLGETAGDGANPFANLLAVGNKIYGLTTEGGATCPHGLPNGCGTVFKLTPSGSTWTEHIVHVFQTAADGGDPFAGLIKVGSTLYGTTIFGGTDNDGVVYSISLPSEAETVLYTFDGGANGSHPNSRLLNVGGTLYGMASGGGISGCKYYYSYDGCGTIYQLVSGGIQTLYSFTGGLDGGNPFGSGGLVKKGAGLYSTTYGGGADNFGTVFKFTP